MWLPPPKFFYPLILFLFFIAILITGKRLILQYRNRWWTPLVLILLQTSQIVISPMPGQVISVLSGFVYGPYLGTLYSIMGITIGGGVAVYISRYWIREYVRRLVLKRKMKNVEKLLNMENAFLFLPYFFLPNPFGDLLIYMMGLSRARYPYIVLTIMIGRLPSTFIYSLIGYGILKFNRTSYMVMLTVSILILTLYTVLLIRRRITWKRRI